MAAANTGQINHAEPGPIDNLVLTQQANHRSEAIWNRQDPGTLTCRSRSKEFSNREPMVDDRVVNIIKALGLEGLLWLPGREIDHGLITALVERWRPETHIFHMPHGEVSITLQDVEVLIGLPVDGAAITGSTQKTWTTVCWDFLGFPYLCPAIERGPPVGAYGPLMRAPLSLKWLWVPNKKNRPANIFRDRYREQIASMLPDQVVWQPYEAEFENLPPWCVAGKAVWTATVPLI
nr:serine/threonine-protein phosphatase 7 long form like [Quercus suber]